jgi:hypothetical protein
LGAGANAVSVERSASGEIIPPADGDSGAYDASGKTPEEIEQDIGETRAELGEILDALERQLAPRQLLERGVDMLKDTMSGDANGLAETLRNHPVPLVLIGAGLGWLLMGGMRGGAGAGEGAAALRGRVAGRASDFAGQVRDKVAGGHSPAAQPAAPAPYPTEAAGYAYARQKSGQARVADIKTDAGGSAQEKLRRAREAGGTAWRRAGDYAGSAGDQLGDMRDRVVQLVEEHPVAVGALGFLAGALTALLLPRSAVEQRWVGPAGERLRHQAAGLGREAGARAQHVAEQTVDAAAGAVRDVVNEAVEHAAGGAPDDTRS